MRVVALSDVGKVRDNNEDAFAVLEKERFFLICDGMGGHQAGEVAAQIAVDNISECVKAIDPSAFEFEPFVKETLKRVNSEIMAYSKSHTECRQMGTTVVVVYIDENHVHVANVGDSRCYTFNQEKLIQISKDHSLVAELVKLGSISEAEAEIHPDRNIITSALGIDEQFEIYMNKVSLDDIKMVLLCTDGLTNMLTPNHLIPIIEEHAFEDLAETMISAANELGGQDNITVICIEL
jgi:protein phosphatase